MPRAWGQLGNWTPSVNQSQWFIGDQLWRTSSYFPLRYLDCDRPPTVPGFQTVDPRVEPPEPGSQTIIARPPGSGPVVYPLGPVGGGFGLPEWFSFRSFLAWTDDWIYVSGCLDTTNTVDLNFHPTEPSGGCYAFRRDNFAVMREVVNLPPCNRYSVQDSGEGPMVGGSGRVYVGQPVSDISVQRAFEYAEDTDTSGPVVPSRAAEFDAYLMTEHTFDTEPLGSYACICPMPDGTVYFGGEFAKLATGVTPVTDVPAWGVFKYTPGPGVGYAGGGTVSAIGTSLEPGVVTDHINELDGIVFSEPFNGQALEPFGKVYEMHPHPNGVDVIMIGNFKSAGEVPITYGLAIYRTVSNTFEQFGGDVPDFGATDFEIVRNGLEVEDFAHYCRYYNAGEQSFQSAPVVIGLNHLVVWENHFLWLLKGGDNNFGAIYRLPVNDTSQDWEIFAYTKFAWNLITAGPVQEKIDPSGLAILVSGAVAETQEALPELGGNSVSKFGYPQPCFDTEIPWLRHKQRDDAYRTSAKIGSDSRSYQRSGRAALDNRYQ